MDSAEFIKTLVLINVGTIIVVSVGFSLLMISLLIINGIMSANDWLFRSIENKIDPPQKPTPLIDEDDEEEEAQQKQLATRTTIKEVYLRNGSSTIPLVREWYNDPDMFSDMTPEMEKLFDQLIEVWDSTWRTIDAKMEKVKSTGITKDVFNIATKLLREDPETKPAIDKLYNVSDQIEKKINGGD